MGLRARGPVVDTCGVPGLTQAEAGRLRQRPGLVRYFEGERGLLPPLPIFRRKAADFAR